MRQELFKVEDRFKIATRGVAVTGSRREDLPGFKIGSPIVLVLPEGREIMTEVGGFDLFQTVSGGKGVAILLRNLTKEHIPVGTKVYLEKTG